MRNHDHRVTQLEQTQSPGPLTIEGLISEWPQEERPGELPWPFDDAEKVIDHAVRSLSASDQAAFGEFIKSGMLPENPAAGLYQVLVAELLVEASLALRVGDAPARKQRRGWV